MLFITFSHLVPNIQPQSFNFTVEMERGRACVDDSNNLANLPYSSAYLAEFKHRKDWNSEYIFDCAADLNSLESQSTKPNSGGTDKQSSVLRLS